MKIKKIVSALLAVAVLAPCAAPATAVAAETLPYQNTSLSFEERAADLVSRMTLEEKAAQTGRSAPAIARLGVSKYNYWREGIHGVARQGAATSFPVSLALSNTWDRQLMYEVMDITSTEARGKNNKTDLSYWNPTINMARDPRWGRNEESYGEDPYLTSELGAEAIKGMQGSNDKYLKTISTLKHFAANNVEGERQRGTSIMTDKTLREYYTRAFKDITESSDPASVMSSYNAETITRDGETIVDYIASSANKYLLTDLLRRSWGFSGYVVGDCAAFDNCYSKPSLAVNLFPGMAYRDIKPEMTIAKIYDAGGDLDCGSAAQANVLNSVKQGYMSEETLDAAIYKMFLARMKTGEFDGDGAAYRNITNSVIESDEHVAKAEEAAEKSWVLLENKNNALPIKNNVTKVAVVGSFADKLVLGDYSGAPTKNTSPIDGIKAEIKKLNSDAEVQYLGGITDDAKLFNIKSITLVMKDGTKKPLDLSKAKSVSGMTYSSGKLIDVTPKASAYIENVDFGNVAKIEAELSTGANIGGTLSIGYETANQSVATIEAAATDTLDDYTVCSGDFTGEDGGYSGTADLYITSSAKLEEFSIEAYKTQLEAADYIIAYAATIPKQDGLGSVDASESNDRKSIDLPAHEAHVQALADSEYASKTIVAMSTVGQINVESFKDKCAAVLWTSYNGQTQGTALGKVLTGAVNPSGRLSTTWYAAADLEKMPLGTARVKEDVGGGTAEFYYTSYEIAQAENYPGRTYQYYSGSAVYPFGYGKSYTDFEYSNIAADKTSVDANGTVTITADVQNNGAAAGAEVAQLYVTVPGADGKTLPLKQLKGFERVELNAGEKKTVSFALDIADVNFYDEKTEKNYVVNGEYTVKVAPNADDAGVSLKFNVTGTLSDALKNVTAVPTGIELIGAKSGSAVVPANEIYADASAALTDDTLIMDLAAAEGAAVTYASSNTDVATVDNSGTVKAGSAAGTAIITVSVTLDGITKTDSFPVVTTLKDKISDEKAAANLAALDEAYEACYPSAYTEEDYAALTAIYNRYRENIKNSVIDEDSDAYLASALKEMNAIPKKELKLKNEKGGKITASVPFASAVLIEAKYSGNKLSGLRTTQIAEEKDYELTGYAEGDKVKLMIWDSLGGMKPLLAAVDHTYNEPVPVTEVLFDFADEAFDSFFNTGEGEQLTSGTGMDGRGGWQMDEHAARCTYADKEYTFKRALKGGGGNEEKMCVYFTPESNGMVTVFFRAAPERKVIIKQGGKEEEKNGDPVGGDGVIVAFEREVTAGEPVYIYGGGSNKYIYAVLFRTEGTFTPPAPATPSPTDEPMPSIVSTTKVEFESFTKAWPEPEAKRISKTANAGASGGYNVDCTKNGDVIFLGSYKMDNLAGIEVNAGTKEAGAGVEFFAADVSDMDVSAKSQSEINAILTGANSIGKASLSAVASGNWDNYKALTIRVKTDKTGTQGLFMKCSTNASYCGNFDFFTLMYAAAVQAASAEEKIVAWNGASVALVNEDGQNRVKQLIGNGVEVDITPESFTQSDVMTGSDYVINDILAVDDQLYLGCDDGIIVTMTPCSKCSALKKVCDFDIKSLGYGDGEIILNGDSETATLSIADARGCAVSYEAAKKMAEDGAVIVDVRTAQEYAESVVMDGAINVPLSDFAEWLQAQDEDTTVITCCSTGKRAAAAAQTGLDMGHIKIYAVKYE